jgi:hypothetical protein
MFAVSVFVLVFVIVIVLDLDAAAVAGVDDDRWGEKITDAQVRIQRAGESDRLQQRGAGTGRSRPRRRGAQHRGRCRRIQPPHHPARRKQSCGLRTAVGRGGKSWSTG